MYQRLLHDARLNPLSLVNTANNYPKKADWKTFSPSLQNLRIHWQYLCNSTIPFKIKHPVHNIGTYVMNEFLTAQSGQLFKAHTQWIFEIGLKIEKSLSSKENFVDFGNLPNV